LNYYHYKDEEFEYEEIKQKLDEAHFKFIFKIHLTILSFHYLLKTFLHSKAADNERI
jgi:hypothetical protein